MGLFLHTYFEDLATPLKMVVNIDTLYRAAHDLRSPLSALNMAIYHFKKVSPHLDHLELLDEAILRINSIAEDILHIRKNNNPTMQSFDFIATLRRFIGEANHQLQNKIDIRGLANQPLEPMNVIGNKEDFQRILWNLLQNANEAGASYISLSYQQLTDQLILRIQDNGCGIPRDLLAKIGQEGFTTKTSGYGLGLYTSIKKLRTWSGDLKLLSHINIGTTIEIFLAQSGSSEIAPDSSF